VTSTQSTRVWIITTIDWPSDWFVWGVCSTPEAGAAAIKAQHGDPYVVAWDDLKRTDTEDCWELWGEFEAVPHYSTKHRAGWQFNEYEVVA
jgi:hypothetical protein